MIRVYGPEGTEEYQAAEKLRDLMLRWSPNLASNDRHQVWIIAEAQCYGQAVQDIDLLVLASFGGETPPHVDAAGLSARFRSLCFTVEVKTHPREGVEFEGTRVRVRYDTGKDVTKQSDSQKWSLHSYLKPKLNRSPFCVNLIWLQRVARRDIPAPPHNIVSGEADWEEFLSRLRDSRMQPRSGPTPIEVEYDVGPADVMRSTAQLFTEALPASRLDRLRMERIATRWLKTQQYADKLGEQLLIFRGRGGTGKTVALLRMAHDIYETYGKRVLLLTYNKALVSDLSRLFALMKLGRGIGSGAIRIQTVHSFIRGIAESLAGFEWNSENEFGREYDRCKAESLEMLSLAFPEDIQNLKTGNAQEFDWDYILVDESQDWPVDERDILYKVYHPHSFVLADGIDQFVRSRDHIDWTAGQPAGRLKAQRVPLKKVLRLKAGLCDFTQNFAKQLGLGNWDVEPDSEAQGGRVIIVEGSYLENRELHERVLTESERDGNKPVDALFCVPPSSVEQTPEGPRSVAGSQFRKWGHKVWDGVDPVQRDSFPTGLDQLRIVQYESCRGLEGWTVVNLGFDSLYDLKLRQGPPDSQIAPELFADPEADAQEYAAQWLMIPLTRAIDTLVIEISSVDHPIGRALQAAAVESGKTVEWVKIAAPDRHSGGEGKIVHTDVTELGQFRTGDILIHDAFGTGRILSLRGSSEDPRAEVEFSGGIKNLALNASPIQRL